MAYDPATGYRTELADEAALIRAEVADVVGLDATARARLLAAACRTGVQSLALKSPADRRRVLDYRAPLAPEAEAAFARLRERRRAGRG